MPVDGCVGVFRKGERNCAEVPVSTHEIRLLKRPERIRITPRHLGRDSPSVSIRLRSNERGDAGEWPGKSGRICGSDSIEDDAAYSVMDRVTLGMKATTERDNFVETGLERLVPRWTRAAASALPHDELGRVQDRRAAAFRTRRQVGQAGQIDHVGPPESASSRIVVVPGYQTDRTERRPAREVGAVRRHIEVVVSQLRLRRSKLDVPSEVRGGKGGEHDLRSFASVDRTYRWASAIILPASTSMSGGDCEASKGLDKDAHVGHRGEQLLTKGYQVRGELARIVTRGGRPPSSMVATFVKALDAGTVLCSRHHDGEWHSSSFETRRLNTIRRRNWGNGDAISCSRPRGDVSRERERSGSAILERCSRSFACSFVAGSTRPVHG